MKPSFQNAVAPFYCHSCADKCTGVRNFWGFKKGVSNHSRNGYALSPRMQPSSGRRFPSKALQTEPSLKIRASCADPGYFTTKFKIRSSASQMRCTLMLCLPVDVFVFVNDGSLQFYMSPVDSTDNVGETHHGIKQSFLSIRFPLSGEMNPSLPAHAQSL